MNLFFIYDTLYCKGDEDDPKDAVIYFFPIQATETERYLLCCQLVGIAKFLRITFSSPRTIGLEQGKFAFHWSGRYLLVLGANTDTQSSILQDQLSFLCGIFCFYHGSINNFLKVCNNDRKEFLAKMELSWSRYITLSQCFNNILQFSVNALPVITFRKNAGIGTKANRLLQMCQFNSSVMAGVVFYNSRVLASQFPSQVTNYLSLMSNYNASSPVSNVYDSRRCLPPDVELKYIYLSSKIISKIIAYNHASVGTNIRVKSTKKAYMKSSSLPNYNEYTNSGSEGDVDSGNCSENVQSFDAYTDVTNFCKVSSSSMKIKWDKKLRVVFCCHSRLLRRKLLINGNQNCLKFLMDANCIDEKGNLLETEDSGIHPKMDLEENAHCHMGMNCTQGVNLFCINHANDQYLNNTAELKGRHVRDLEFYCFLCQDGIQSFNPSSLKRWNSEIYLSKMKLGHSFPSSCKCIAHKRRQSNGNKKSKLQLLKCRSSNQSSNIIRSKYNFSSQLTNRNFSRDLHGNKKNNSSLHKKFNSSFNNYETYANIESNELQKYALYVQRYGGSTLILLLNQEYEENIITYLWNCGFSILRDIEYNAEKYLEKNSNGTETYFNMILYENTYKLLKEYPYCLSLMTSEKWIKESIQMMQENFQSDSNIDSISILSANRSIHASHKDQYFAFYIQLESNSRKLETLSNLSKKAIRRLEKYFKIIL